MLKEAKDLFDQACKLDQGSGKALEIYKEIVALLCHQPDILSSSELRILIISAEKVFLYSGKYDIQDSTYIASLCELFLCQSSNDSQICEIYVFMLEFSHQYEKSWYFLQSILSYHETKKVALNFLSSYTYCAEGLQNIKKCIEYKEELIALTTNEEEQEKLQLELQTMLDMLK